jgi:hypothetical protein
MPQPKYMVKFKRLKELFLEHEAKILSILTFAILLGFIYKWASDFIPSLPYISWPKIHLFVIPLIIVWGVSILASIYFRSEQEHGATLNVELVFWFSIFNVCILWLLFRYYNNEFLQQYNSVRLALGLMKCSLYFFGATALVTFFLTVIYSRTFNVFEELISGKTEPQKFFVLGRWQIRKESRDQALYLMILFMIGLVLRLYNVDGFPPYYDEYGHIRTTMELYEGVEHTYNRAFYTVTMPVYLSYLVFGPSLFSSRLPMVIINMLAIFPLFVLSKKLNRTVGYIAVALFVFSPWVIAVSRTVREYAVLPVIFFLAATYLFDLLDWGNGSLKKFLRTHKFKLVFLCLLVVYIFIDRYSILKVVLITYAIVGGLAILRFIKQNTLVGRKRLLAFVGVAAITAILILRAGFIQRHLYLNPMINFIGERYWKTLIGSEIHQWYFLPEIGYFIIFSVSYLFFRMIFSKYNNKNFIVLFCYLNFVAILIFLTCFFPSGITRRIRYGILIAYWYIPVVAIALYLIYRLGKKYLPRNIHLIISIILMVLFTNTKGIWTVMSFQGGSKLKITGEMHYSVQPALEFLSNRLTSEDVLLTDILHIYNAISGNKLHPDEIIFSLDRAFAQQSDGFSVIEKYPQGWVAASSNNTIKRINLPYEDFVYEDKQALFYGMQGDIYIWQWFTQIPENPENP